MARTVRRRCIVTSLGALGVLAVQLLASPVQSAANPGQASADSVRIPLPTRIARLEQILRQNPSDAPAHHALSRCYLEEGTPYARMLARAEVQKALSLDPDNVPYLMTCADLLWRGGLIQPACDKFEEVLRLDPANADAASGIARYHLFDMFRYRDMTAVEGSVVRSLRTFGDQARDRASAVLWQALKANPDHRPSVARLCLLYYEDARADSMLCVARDFLERHPDDAEIRLYEGLALQTRREFEDAARAYEHALRVMSPEERSVMEAVDALRDAGGPRTRGPQTASTTGDFWGPRDPLLITPYNERRMEHYGRVAYANLRFGLPEEGVPGWKTDQGQMTIRYGRPFGLIVARPEIEIPPRRQATPYRETWAYEGFSVTFQNWDGLDHWRFEAFRYPEQRYPVSDKQDLFARFPERAADPYRDWKYDLPHQVAAFKGEAGTVRIEASYAVPVSPWRYRLAGGGGRFSVDLDRGAFLLDTARTEVSRTLFRDTDAHPITLDPRGPLWTVFRERWTVAPGRYTAVIEAQDNRSGRIGQARREVDARRLALPGLCLSDLLVGSDIRDNGEVIPNPIRTFGLAENLVVYFEVYGLSPGAGSVTSYEVSCTVGQPSASERDARLFPEVPEDTVRTRPAVVRVIASRPGLDPLSRSEARFYAPAQDARVMDYRVDYGDESRLSERRGHQPRIDTGRKGVSTTVTLRYEGSRIDEPRVLRVDLRHIRPGIQKLSLTVKDLQAETQASAWTLIQVVE